MAFSIKITGLEELNRNMEKLGEAAPGIAAHGLYEGAGVVADAVTRGVNSITTEPFRYAKNGAKRKPSPEEKAILQQARHGVAKFRNSGTDVQTSIGLQNSGYASLKGKTKPIPQIANAINSGTSFMDKQPFFRKAASQAKSAAVAKTEAKIKQELDKLDL